MTVPQYNGSDKIQEASGSTLHRDAGKCKSADLMDRVFKCPPGIFASLSRVHLGTVKLLPLHASSSMIQLGCQRLDNSQRLEDG